MLPHGAGAAERETQLIFLRSRVWSSRRSVQVLSLHSSSPPSIKIAPTPPLPPPPPPPLPCGSTCHTAPFPRSLREYVPHFSHIAAPKPSTVKHSRSARAQPHHTTGGGAGVGGSHTTPAVGGGKGYRTPQYSGFEGVPTIDDDDDDDDDDAADVAAAAAGAGPRAQPHHTTPPGGGGGGNSARQRGNNHTTEKGGGNSARQQV